MLPKFVEIKVTRWLDWYWGFDSGGMWSESVHTQNGIGVLYDMALVAWFGPGGPECLGFWGQKALARPHSEGYD